MIKNVCKAEEADLKFIFVDKDFQLLPGPPAGALRPSSRRSQALQQALPAV